MSVTTSIEKNKAIYQRYIQELFNEGRFENFEELVSPNYVLHTAEPGAPNGPEVIKVIASMFRSAFSDFSIRLESLVAEGDLVTARATTRGKHTGNFFGIAATGKTIEMGGLTMVRVSDGRICESWVRNDMMGLMKQLGVLK